MNIVVKAEIKKKDGTNIVIEGSEEEVKRLLDSIHESKPTKTQKTKESKETKKGKMSISDMIWDLREEGFFKSPKGLIDIKNALSAKGGIYEVTTLSASMIRLIRRRNMGRIKRDNKWMYVQR